MWATQNEYYYKVIALNPTRNAQKEGLKISILKTGELIPFKVFDLMLLAKSWFFTPTATLVPT